MEQNYRPKRGLSFNTYLSLLGCNNLTICVSELLYIISSLTCAQAVAHIRKAHLHDGGCMHS